MTRRTEDIIVFIGKGIVYLLLIASVLACGITKF
jgi:hypothetical protein